jgi:quinol monooxygenase YgiN
MEGRKLSAITKVQGRLATSDQQAAMEHHNRIVDALIPRTRELGGTGHHVYANVADPMQFLAIDDWDSVESLSKFLSDPSVQAEIGGMFDGPPDVSIWVPREGWRTF